MTSTIPADSAWQPTTQAEEDAAHELRKLERGDRLAATVAAVIVSAVIVLVSVVIGLLGRGWRP